MHVRLQVLKENNKSRFDSYTVRNSVLIISHITLLPFGIAIRVHMFSTTFLECIYNQNKYCLPPSKAN